MASAVASAHTPSSTPQHHHLNTNHQHHYHFSNERVSPIPGYHAPHNNYLQTPTKTSTVIRIVTKPIESIMVDGENPFRPEGELFKEAEEEIRELVRSQSASPLPKHEIEEIVIPKEVLDSEFPLLANRHSISSNGPPTNESSSSAISSATSKNPSRNPPTVVEVTKPSKVTEPDSPKFETRPAKPGVVHVVPTEKRDREVENIAKNPTDKDAPAKKKKKRKVGCGGDKSCSIM